MEDCFGPLRATAGLAVYDDAIGLAACLVCLSKGFVLVCLEGCEPKKGIFGSVPITLWRCDNSCFDW